MELAAMTFSWSASLFHAKLSLSADTVMQKSSVHKAAAEAHRKASVFIFPQ